VELRGIPDLLTASPDLDQTTPTQEKLSKKASGTRDPGRPTPVPSPFDLPGGITDTRATLKRLNGESKNRFAFRSQSRHHPLTGTLPAHAQLNCDPAHNLVGLHIALNKVKFDRLFRLRLLRNGYFESDDALSERWDIHSKF
jgi:hypothetical protein